MAPKKAVNVRLFPCGIIERVRALLSYDPNTGIVVWIAKSSSLSRVQIGDSFGGIDDKGYISGKIDGTKWYAHQLAFILVLGYLPELVDHRDRTKTNNRWDNIRPANHEINNRNTAARNELGVKHVYRSRSRFAAIVTHEGRALRLGTFDTIYEASQAVLSFELTQGEVIM